MRPRYAIWVLSILPPMSATKALIPSKLKETVTTAVRMLDNVIDINFYPTVESKAANQRHRPVGLGIMGFQDALYSLNFSYASQEAVDFADESMEAVSYYALQASMELARERGAYSSFKGSKWDRGFLPIDTIELLEKERGGYLDMDRTVTHGLVALACCHQTNGLAQQPGHGHCSDGNHRQYHRRHPVH